MTVGAVPRARARAGARAAVPTLAIACGCVALATRPHAWRSSGTLVLVGALALLGDVPVRERTARACVWLSAVALGIGAFALVRMIDLPLARPFTVAVASMNVLAAVAEEAFFRRYAYGWLVRWGSAVAIAVTGVLFALVHVPQYGWGVAPLDLAAGLLLGWQRMTTGTWTAPAATHAVANLLQMG